MRDTVEQERRRQYCRVECMLFVAGDPVPLAELARVLGCGRDEARALVGAMEEDYRAEGRGFYPLLTETAVQLVSNPAYVELSLIHI